LRSARAGRPANARMLKAAALALRNGASVRAVAQVGVSPNTVQKYGAAHGWPTEENGERSYDSRYDRDEQENGAP
jgi:uncharacterized protein YjcR